MQMRRKPLKERRKISDDDLSLNNQDLSRDASFSSEIMLMKINATNR